jgi:2-hydroxy-3-keto-5-methylthiopentenyl-1-phosphate phosphatase
MTKCDRDVVVPAFRDFLDFIEENSLEWYIVEHHMDVQIPECETTQ